MEICNGAEHTVAKIGTRKKDTYIVWLVISSVSKDDFFHSKWNGYRSRYVHVQSYKDKYIKIHYNDTRQL